MSSPLSSTLAITFLVYFKKNWLQSCSYDLNHHYYRWHVDDIFVLFTSRQHLEAFWNLLTGDMLTYYLQLKMKSKAEYPILVYRFFAKINHLPLSSTVNFHLMEFIHTLTAFLPFTYKFGNAYILVYRSFQIYPSCTKLHTGLV